MDVEILGSVDPWMQKYKDQRIHRSVEIEIWRSEDKYGNRCTFN
jgi:hypothetical protein